MGIGVLQRVAYGFTGIVIAIAVVLCVTPVGAAPASGGAAYTGGPKAHAPKRAHRAKHVAEPVLSPRPDPQPPVREPEREKANGDEGKQLPQVSNAAGEPLEVSAECEENLAIAAKRGLTLPEGWGIKCVGPGLDWSGNSHWGVTCPYDSCPEGAGPYVSISNPNYYVVTHELCHANFGNDELMADQCAAEHGASLETSPYQ